jgi:putative glutamine amidotransferase
MFMAKRPRIGLTMRLELATRRFYLGRDYSESIEMFGAVPVHLSLIPTEDHISAAVEGLDGILLPGCDSDLDPLLYGEEPHPNLGPVVPEKDKTDLLVLSEAERLNLPVLAICYGMQALNVSRGGSLIQDIASQVDDHIKHEQGVPRDRSSHGVEIEEGSILSGLPAFEASKGTLRVNSHHHQAVRTVGKDLRATAWAKDGVIEGIEDTRDERFVLGVQWHPELSTNSDDLSRDIFSTFVDACRRRSGT